MPDESAVRKWATLRTTTALVRSTRAHARAMQAEHYADEVIEIVDTDPDPVRARIRMDDRKWVSSKLAPKKYGGKIETENRTRVATDNPLAALMERIATSGNKIYDRRS